ncbi:hypothetical protein [Mycobacterium riyadhense]|uniref:hypothetical protein n=1 Tax=Mycobacterium riyadhense TaxID=486698 RepID=UPI002094323B|nr:hypothetical protein [Mycobacterium riyadhense]
MPNGARAKSGLSRSIGDAGWGGFVLILRAKAEDAGRIWIEVDPSATININGATQTFPAAIPHAERKILTDLGFKPGY